MKKPMTAFKIAALGLPLILAACAMSNEPYVTGNSNAATGEDRTGVLPSPIPPVGDTKK